MSEGLSDEQEARTAAQAGTPDAGIASDLEVLRVVERPDPLGLGARRARRRWPIVVLLVLLVAGIAGGFAFEHLTQPPEVAIEELLGVIEDSIS